MRRSITSGVSFVGLFSMGGASIVPDRQYTKLPSQGDEKLCTYVYRIDTTTPNIDENSPGVKKVEKDCITLDDIKEVEQTSNNVPGYYFGSAIIEIGIWDTSVSLTGDKATGIPAVNRLTCNTASGWPYARCTFPKVLHDIGVPHPLMDVDGKNKVPSSWFKKSGGTNEFRVNDLTINQVELSLVQEPDVGGRVRVYHEKEKTENDIVERLRKYVPEAGYKDESFAKYIQAAKPTVTHTPEGYRVNKKGILTEKAPNKQQQRFARLYCNQLAIEHMKTVMNSEEHTGNTDENFGDKKSIGEVVREEKKGLFGSKILRFIRFTNDHNSEENNCEFRVVLTDNGGNSTKPPSFDQLLGGAPAFSNACINVNMEKPTLVTDKKLKADISCNERTHDCEISCSSNKGELIGIYKFNKVTTSPRYNPLINGKKSWRLLYNKYTMEKSSEDRFCQIVASRRIELNASSLQGPKGRTSTSIDIEKDG